MEILPILFQILFLVVAVIIPFRLVYVVLRTVYRLYKVINQPTKP